MKLINFYIVIALFFLALSKTSAADENRVFGPFEISDQFPLSAYHLSPSPESVFLNTERTLEIASNFIWTNINTSRKNAYEIDAETRLINLEAKYSPEDDTQLSISLPFMWQGGGVLDHIIYEWHELWGMPQGERNYSNAREDQFETYGLNKSGSEIDPIDNGYSLGDVVLGIKHLIVKNSAGSPAVSISAYFRLPTATNYYKQDSIDIGLAVLSGIPFESFVLQSGLGFIYFNDQHEDNIGFSSNQEYAFVSFEYTKFDSWAPIATITVQTSAIDNIIKYPEYAVYFDFGIKTLLAKQAIFEIACRENLAPPKGTSDVSLIIGTSFKFN